MLLVIVLATLLRGIVADHETTECTYRKLGLIEGNVTLGFMFSFFDSYDETSTICDEGSIPNLDNIQLVEAAIFAVKQAEGRIPGITIGLEVYDLCYSGAVAVEKSVSFLQDRIIGQGENNTVQGCGEKVKPGLISSLDDGLGVVVGPLMSNALVATTGYSSSLLQQSTTNGQEYITRTIPSHIEEIRVITDLLNMLNMTYVFLVSTTDEESTLRANIFLEMARQNKICVSQHYQLDVTYASHDDIQKVYSDLTMSPVSSLVLMSENDLAREFLEGRSMLIAHQLFIPYKLFLSLPYDSSSIQQNGIFSAVPESLDTSQEDDFDMYFKGLSLSNHSNHADPWFQYFWETRYSCSFDGGDGRQLCNATAIEEHMMSYQRNPFVTTVIDAVDAHIQALADVLSCNGSTCDPLPAFTQEYYLEKLKIVDVNSQVGTRRRVAFKPSGDPEETTFLIMALPPFMPSQSLVVTRWRNGVFVDPLTKGIIYFSSRCQEPCLDPMCFSLREQQEQLVAYVEGDLILAGFFPVNEWVEESSECGSLTPNGALYVEAMLYAIETINSDSSVLPFVSLGMDGFNTCNSPQRASDLALDLLSQGSFDLSHSTTRVSPNGTRLEHIFGIVGPNTLEEVSVVNKVVSSKKVPMMAYSVDDPSINTFSFPYLGRITPSTVSFIHPLFRYMSTQKIFLFQLLYVDDGSTGIRTLLSYFGAGGWVNVCLAQSIKIPQSDDESLWNAMFETMSKTPDAKAVFILAPSETILKVLRNMENRTLAGQYLILAGPSWELTDDDIQGLTVTKGALIVRSPKQSYTGFKDYVSGLSPTNRTQNPWFADYWMRTFNCSLTGDGNLPNCTGQETLQLDSEMDDPVIPQIIDATYALAQTFHILQVQECSSPGQKVCPELLKVDGDTFMEVLRDMTTFNSINDQRPLSFDFQLSRDYSYDVVNVQDGMMVRIGTMESFQVSPLPGQTWKFYDEEGQEITNTSDFSIQCTTTMCQNSCQRPDTDAVAESSSDGSGDIWIGGFFELTEPTSDILQCSDKLVIDNVPLLEAFLFAIDQINLNQDVLPDLKLSGIGFDSCGSPQRVTREAGNLVSGTVDYRLRFSSQQLTVFGAIGGATSDTTDELSVILSAQGINQISYAATATQFSDPSRYPFLLRTVPSDLDQTQVFVDILEAYDWRYVSVVFSDDIYGNDLSQTFSERISSDICIAMTLAVERGFNESSFDRLVSVLQSNPSSRVVLLFTSDVDTRSVLEAAQRQNVTDVQWIGSDTWGSNNFVVERAGSAALGAITVSFRNERVEPFVDYISQLNPYTTTRNPWFRRYFQDLLRCDLYGQPEVYKTFCNFADKIPAVAVNNPQVASVINAVYAYAYGLDKALKQLCPNVINHHICQDLENQPEVLHAIIEELTFPSAQNPSVNFTFNEDGDAEGRYDILNLVAGVDSLAYKKVGSWDTGNLVLEKDMVSLRRGDDPTQCSGRCSECRSPEVEFASLDGVLQMAGLAQVHKAGDHVGECGPLKESGVLDVEAFLFAINIINSNNDILPGIQLGAKIFDSCQSGVKSVRELSSFYSGTGTFSNEMTWQYRSGVVGGATPSVTELTYNVLQQYQHPQISYSLTPNLGDDKYLIRTTPTVDALVGAVHDLLENFDWTAVSVIADSDDEAQLLLYNAFLESSARLCIDSSTTFDADNLDNVVSSLGEANVVVMFAGAHVINSMTKATSNHKTFVFPGVTTVDALEMSEAITGSLVLSFSQSATDFESFLSELSPVKPSDNPWRQEYLSDKLQCNVGDTTEYERDCTASDNLGSVRRQDTVNARQIINGVFALATSLHNVQQEKCGEGSTGLCPAFLMTSVSDSLAASANLITQNENSDEVIFQNGQQLLSITVWNIGSPMENDPVKLADWNGTLSLVPATAPQFFDESNKPVQTVKSSCTQSTTAATSNTARQMTNSVGTNTPSNGTSNTMMKTPGRMSNTPGRMSEKPNTSETPNKTSETLCGQPENYHQEPWFILALILSSLGVLFCLLVAVTYFLNSDTNYAQLHSDLLIYMLLTGTILMFLQTIPFGLRVTPFVCALRRILPGVSFSLAFISIFLMVGRYFRILKKEQRVSGLGAKYVDSASQMVAFLPFAAVEVIILFQWLLYKIPDINKLQPGKCQEVLRCQNIDQTFPVSFMYIYLLMCGSILTALLALRRSKVFFTSELRGTIACCVLSLILGAAWIVCLVMGEVDLYVPATGFLGVIQGYLILVAIFPFIVKKLFRDEEHMMDTASIADTNSVVDGDVGFRNPVSVFEKPYDDPPLSKEKPTTSESEM